MKYIVPILFLIPSLLSSQNSISSQVYDIAVKSVVLVETKHSFGSGFFVSEDGWIVTNKHVIETDWGTVYAPSKITIKLYNGEQLGVHRIELINVFKDTDLAFLKTNYNCYTPLPLVEFSLPKIQEDVITIGHPFGSFWTSTKGVISNIHTSGNFSDFLQIDAATNPGNSGGPLLNMQGQVIGVNTLVMRDAQNLNLSIKSTVLAELLKEKKIRFKTTPLIINKSEHNQKVDIPLNTENIIKIDDAKTKAEIERIEQERNLQEEKIEAERKRLKEQREKVSQEKKYSKPYLLNFKIGASIASYYGVINNLDKKFDFQNNMPNLFSFIGIRFDATNINDFGNLFGFFGRFGRISPEVTNLIAYEQYNSITMNNKPFNFVELETGFILNEWFRVSIGYGKLIAESNLAKWKRNDYYVGNIGFNFNWGVTTYEVSSSLTVNNKIENISLRVNLGTGFSFDIFK